MAIKGTLLHSLKPFWHKKTSCTPKSSTWLENAAQQGKAST